MADFETAFARTLGHEGGYVNDPDDAGGETYKGISRKYNPSWEGWKTIDSVREMSRGGSDFEKELDGNEQLQKDVRSFYKKRYWDAFRGDEIQDTEVAAELFDTGVNMGVARAVAFLQKSLNLLNRNQVNYADIAEDGRFGPGTMKAFNALMQLEKDDNSILLKLMNILQGMHYIEYMQKKPEQEKYARGWLKRVVITKH